ncbi:MAG: hypothetical protein K2N46_10070 [Lachnospiraceae bacterium]|nr:hypothetical protein [Lachnospiraceae bacterium]
MDASKVKDIIGDHKRFVSPFSEPCGYYIFAGDNETISSTVVQMYWEKLKFMSEHTDLLIQQAFRPEFYDFYGVSQSDVASSDEMCRRLIVDSFVLCNNDYAVECCLSNDQFMFGHFIVCSWDNSWNFTGSYIC